MPPADRRTEDKGLTPRQRDRLIDNARDQIRNYAVVAWAVRAHLTYTTEHTFHAKTGDDGLDSDIEQLVRIWGNPEYWDALGRTDRASWLRLAEGRSVVDGDVGALWFDDGTVQGIEGDLIRDPPTAKRGGSDRWVHGVRVWKGRHMAYSIHKRTGSNASTEFDRIAPAGRMYLLGYQDRFDQVRGISPLSAALNDFRDVREAQVYALAKAKVAQLFALKISRTNGVSPEPKEYAPDFGAGPVLLDLDAGDEADFLEAKTPATEFQSFMQTVLTLALKSLDLPLSFLDEAHSNFFGSRSAWQHYDNSCRHKRARIQRFLRWATNKRILLAVARGEIVLPQTMTVEDLLAEQSFEWVPSGMPWWNPIQEVTGAAMSFAMGLDTPQRYTKETLGSDWYDNMAEIAKAFAHAAELGVPLSFATSNAPAAAAADSQLAASIDAANNNKQQRK